ncbi:ABC transporter ATP-binding protein [Verrucosispora sp. WMMD573]|uniref:ABC transporter ATP-binding protein n=1 Tax=Verrucosispora sp. WMMD573 TaxID=3015149 RepID=UPI00248ADD30|nr:ABC transporter ATP-binding protein [Verrucosispora sp. WMMD573]WBB52481.1 ABC transporter ATP-binding protein [Verrucosispora sp. WMMD573]
MTLLELSDVTAGYGGRHAVRDLNVRIAPAGRVAVLGANGAGKSTLLRAISGLIDVTGSIRFNGEEIRGRRPQEIVSRGVAHVPEGRGTFGQLTVEENLTVGAFTRKDGEVAEDIDKVYGYFPVLRERRRQKAAALSGGEQQMLAIGRALMLRPRLLLLDEPSLGLAPRVTADVFAILREIHGDSGVGILVVEQNAELALAFVDHAYVLETGRVVAAATSDELRGDAHLRRAYLGY